MVESSTSPANEGDRPSRSSRLFKPIKNLGRALRSHSSQSDGATQPSKLSADHNLMSKQGLKPLIRPSNDAITISGNLPNGKTRVNDSKAASEIRAPCEPSKPDELTSNIATNQQPTTDREHSSVEDNSTQVSQAPDVTAALRTNAAPIWSKVLGEFEKEEPKLYDLLKNALQAIDFEKWNDLSSLDTPQALAESKMKRNSYILRLQRYLPSIATIKAFTMTLSGLDPHKIAPFICGAIFFAIELSLNTVDPALRDKVLDHLSITSGIINSWILNENYFIRGSKSAVSGRVTQLQDSLPQLYHEGLCIICSIYNDFSSKIGRMKAAFDKKDDKWRLSLNELKRKHARCSEIKALVEADLKKQEENKKILDWIFNIDPEVLHDTVMKRGEFKDPESVAGNWFIETDEFQSWVNSIQPNTTTERVFWLSGIMGTGKTTLVCRTISHLREFYPTRVKIVHYYCSGRGTARDTEGPDYETIVRGLCHQLAWSPDGVADAARKLYDESTSRSNRPPTRDDWIKLLCDLIPASAPVAFLIDALDECKTLGDQRSFLKLISQLKDEYSRLYILFSSRPHVPVNTYFDGSVRKFSAKSQKADNDMDEFIRSQISTKKNYPCWKSSILLTKEELFNRLVRALTETAGGMYRWVEVWLGVFFPKNDEEIYLPQYADMQLKKLEELESLEAIDDDKDEKNINRAYKMLWITNAGQQSKALQIRAFRLVLCAFKPLNPVQLLEAIRFDPDNPDSYEEAIGLQHLERLYQNFLTTNSQGFLVFEHISAKVFVLHMKNESSQREVFSALENHWTMSDLSIKVLERPRHKLWKLARVNLLAWETRLKDLSTFTEMRSKQFHVTKMIGPHEDFEGTGFWGLENIILVDHFVGYLSIFWVWHCQKVSSRVIQRVQSLALNPVSGFQGWCLALAVVQHLFPTGAYPKGYFDDMKLMAQCTYDALIQSSLEGQSKVMPDPFLVMISFDLSPLKNCKDEKGRGIIASLKDITAQNLHKMTPLHIASARGNSAIVMNLLELEYDLKSSRSTLLILEDSTGKIPLHYASSDDVVKVLLRLEAQEAGLQFPPPTGALRESQLLEWRDNSDETPMAGIIRSRSDDLGRWLLERYRVDPNQRSRDGNALLHLGITAGNQMTLQLLLDQGADINAIEGLFGTALETAIGTGNSEILQLLLNKGADVNAIGGFCGTALQTATFVSNLGDLQILLDRGADVDVKGGLYGTALQAAACLARLDFIQPLLDRRPDINAIAGEYGTALQAAVYGGNFEILQLLLDHGADVNTVGGRYGTALQRAAYMGNLKVLQLLLDKGADVNVMGGFYGTALQAAAFEGHLDIFQLLLNKGADVNIMGGEYGTALQAAAYMGRLKFMQLLLDRGANVNAMGGEHGTALRAVRMSPFQSEAVVDLLISNGAQKETDNQ